MSDKVVGVERAPAYLRHRAMLQWQKGHLIEALSLMRRAQEGEPHNTAYRLDLAEMYHAAGRCEQSTRLLLDAYVGDASAELDCLFGLMINQLSMGHAAQGMELMNAYFARLTADTGSPSEEREQGFPMEFMMPLEMETSRREARAQRLADWGAKAFSDDVDERAIRLLRASLERAPERQEVRAMLAMATFAGGDEDEALALCREATRGEANLRAVCIAARLLIAMGRKEEARECLRAHVDTSLVAEDADYIAALGEAELHEEALTCARVGLRDHPCDRDLLHAAAAAMCRLSHGPDQAARVWQRMLRIDPEDAVARYYVDACRRGTLVPGAVPYACELPREEIMRRSLVIAQALQCRSLEALGTRWREEEDFRTLIQWALSTDVVALRRAAVTVLANVDDPEAMSRLRSALYNNASESELQLTASIALGMHGVSLRDVLPEELNAWRLAPGQEKKMLEKSVVNDRALVHYAAGLLDASDEERAALIGLWTRYRETCAGGFDAMTHPKCAALTLLRYSARRRGKRAQLNRLARQLHCSPRRLIYYDRRLHAVMTKWVDEE